MKSFLILVGTFFGFYFAVPWLVHQVLWMLGVAPDLARVSPGLTFLIIVATYTVLRRLLGERMPHV